MGLTFWLGWDDEMGWDARTGQARTQQVDSTHQIPLYPITVDRIKLPTVLFV